MIDIIDEKCIGCGLCEKVCRGKKHLAVIDGKARAVNTHCNDCGQCFAACPQGAIEMPGYDWKDIKTYDPERFTLDSEHLLNVMQFRRSVRDYRDQAVEESKFAKIFDAGRYAPTGSNRQDVRYVVVQEKLPALRKMMMEALLRIGDKMKQASEANGLPVPEQAARFADMQLQLEAGEDPLFYHAPALVVLVGRTDYSMPPEVNTMLACSNMELMANTLGLGVCYNGFFALVAQESEEIRAFLNLSDAEKVTIFFMVGYPDIHFYRTVPRNAADITWC